MELFFTSQTIIIGTLVGFVFGSLWYSPILFMNAWLQGIGVTKEQLPTRSKKYMTQIMTYAFLAHGAIAATVAAIFDVVEVTSLPQAVYWAVFLSFGFIVTTRFIDMVYTVQGAHYELKPQLNFFVSAGYYVCLTIVMSITMFLATVYLHTV